MLRHDPFKVPLTHQTVQGAAIAFNVVQVAQPMWTLPARNHTAQPAFPFEQRKYPQVLAGDLLRSFAAQRPVLRRRHLLRIWPITI
jgi:hypothetical protein